MVDLIKLTPAITLDDMLSDDAERERWSRNAQKRVFTEFLVFAQMQHWLRVLADCVSRTGQKLETEHATPAAQPI